MVRTMLIAAVFLLLIHQAQGQMKATAVLYGDNSMNSFGTLTFSQNDTNAAVSITGTLSGLNISSAHVNLKAGHHSIDPLFSLGFSYSYGAGVGGYAELYGSWRALQSLQ